MVLAQLVWIPLWAAGNGDRSERGDYIYAKKRLREIDRGIGILTKRLAKAVVVDSAEQENAERRFFGAIDAFVKPMGGHLSERRPGRG